MKTSSKIWAIGLLMAAMLVCFTSCKERNTPSGGGSSYSGYAPTLAGMKGRWLDIGIMMKFRYNGSSWDVAPSDIATYLQNKDLQVSSGSISYMRADNYSALLEFNIVYSYKAGSSSSRTTGTFRGSSIILDFNSSTGGTWNGLIGSSAYTNRKFTLSY